MDGNGLLLVISGPSGVGKGTIINELKENCKNHLHKEFFVSISATTRAPRKNEVDGIHYHFVTMDVFKNMIDDGLFLEYATYAGNLYGTPYAEILQHLETGKIVVLDIDIQGALQIKNLMQEALTIFVMPPTEAELIRRLKGRGTETHANMRDRLRIGRDECRRADEFDYLVFNDSLENAVKEICDIIKNRLLSVETEGEN